MLQRTKSTNGNSTKKNKVKNSQTPKPVELPQSGPPYIISDDEQDLSSDDDTFQDEENVVFASNSHQIQSVSVSSIH